MADGGDTGGTRTVAHSGTHPSGPRGGGHPWGEDGPQAQAIAPTGRSCPEADRARRTPRHRRALAQRVAADAIPGVAGLTITTLHLASHVWDQVKLAV